MTEVHIQTFAVGEIRIRATAMENDLRHALLYDLKILRPRGQENKRVNIWERERENQCIVLSFWKYGITWAQNEKGIVKLTLNSLTETILAYTSY